MIELFCSSEVYREADAAYEPVRKWLESKLIPKLERIDAGEVNALIYFIPSIMPPSTAQEFKPVLRYLKRENAIEFRPAFDFAEFMSATAEERKRVVSRSLKEIIPLTRKLGLKPQAGCELIEAVTAIHDD